MGVFDPTGPASSSSQPRSGSGCICYFTLGSNHQKNGLETNETLKETGSLIVICP